MEWNEINHEARKQAMRSYFSNEELMFIQDALLRTTWTYEEKAQVSNKSGCNTRRISDAKKAAELLRKLTSEFEPEL